MYLCLRAIIIDIIPNISYLFSKVKLALTIFGMFGVTYMLIILRAESKYYSCWKFEDSIAAYLFVEQIDGEATHIKLNEIVNAGRAE
jgi:hypothetical protein